MVNTSFQIRNLEIQDIPSALDLVKKEGWNQTEADWRILIQSPLNICLAAVSDGKLVGTATAINYHNEVAWIGMVIVNSEYRGRGISKVLLSDIINKLHACKSIKLDATPAGQPVYAKIGFREEYVINRMIRQDGKPEQQDLSNTSISNIETVLIPEIIKKDKKVFGAERDILIKSMITDDPDLAWIVSENSEHSAFSIGRRGSRFTQIGPICAHNIRDAKNLVLQVLQQDDNIPYVIDVPVLHSEFTKWLESLGFAIVRPFTRMYLGDNLFPGIIENQYCICGPEYG